MVAQVASHVHINGQPCSHKLSTMFTHKLPATVAQLVNQSVLTQLGGYNCLPRSFQVSNKNCLQIIFLFFPLPSCIPLHPYALGEWNAAHKVKVHLTRVQPANPGMPRRTNTVRMHLITRQVSSLSAHTEVDVPTHLGRGSFYASA